MATEKQKLGALGEKSIVKLCTCPKCKRRKSLKQLPPNFKCADLVCDFCGFLAQVKTKTVKNISALPKQVIGAAWRPQKERMDSSIYFPLYLVLKAKKEISIYYLSADLKSPDLFVARKPLSSAARRAGWQGFYYDLTMLQKGAMVRLL